MSGTIHAFDLAKPPAEKPKGVCPLFGSERFLQRLAVKELVNWLADGDTEFSATEFDGNTCAWADVVDELSTRSLFGGDGPRIVVVDEADKFVKNHRDQLEKLVEKPAAGLLVIVVSSWASNTKLYKRIDKAGLQIRCDAPTKGGRSKARDDSKVIKWLVKRAKAEYDFKLPETCATVLIELTECNFGRMEQELAKLTLYVDADEPFEPNAVRMIVGGWSKKTMWEAIDAAADGRAGHALDMLDQLFRSGEHPLAMFGQISWSLRRFAEVGEIASRDVRNRRRFDMKESLKTAGFRAWGGEIANAERRLKEIGRERVGQLYSWLAETDLALKRTHSKAERGRLMLEKLFVRLAEEVKQPASS